MPPITIFRRLVLCLAVSPLFAGEDNSFYIESIQFQGLKHVSQTILLAELKLEVGAFHTEEQLRNGQYRLERLPFIWRTDLALRKGSKRGAYRLVITVEEMRRFFWLFQPNLVYTNEHYFDTDDPGDSFSHIQVSALSVGYRWFFRKSELQVFAPGLISYSHYDLFGLGTVLNTGLGPTPGEWNPDDSFGRSPFPLGDELAELAVSSADLFGYLALSQPVGRDQWVNVNGFTGGGELESLSPLTGPNLLYDNTSVDFGNVSANWIYNTTDHPTFTTSGTILQVGAARDWLSFDFDESFTAYQEWERDRLFFNGRKYWEWRPDQTLGVLVNASWGKNRHRSLNAPAPEDYQSGKFGVNLLYGRNFLGRRFWKKDRDFRFEVRTGYNYSASGLDGVTPDPEYGQYELEISFAARDNFGTLRLGLRYESVDRGLWP